MRGKLQTTFSARRAVLLAAVMCCLAAACGTPPNSFVSDALAVARPPDWAIDMHLLSPHMPEGGKLRLPYACTEWRGQNQSPPLYWNNWPSHAKAFAVTLVDMSTSPTPTAQWGLIDIPGNYSSLVQGLRRDTLPAGSWQLISYTGRTQYEGPCPPVGGASHLYVFTLYALGGKLGQPSKGVTLADIADELAAKSIKVAELAVTFP